MSRPSPHDTEGMYWCPAEDEWYEDLEHINECDECEETYHMRNLLKTT